MTQLTPLPDRVGAIVSTWPCPSRRSACCSTRPSRRPRGPARVSPVPHRAEPREADRDLARPRRHRAVPAHLPPTPTVVPMTHPPHTPPPPPAPPPNRP